MAHIRAAGGHRQHKREEMWLILRPDTRIDPRAVMIHLKRAPPTLGAVVCTRWERRAVAAVAPRSMFVDAIDIIITRTDTMTIPSDFPFQPVSSDSTWPQRHGTTKAEHDECHPERKE